MTRPVTQATPTDGELLRRCQQRDESAWRELVRRFSPLVYSTALGIGLDDEAVDEVYQQVWVEFHRSILRIRSASALASWFGTTTGRIALRTAYRTRRFIELSFDIVEGEEERPDSRLVDFQERHRLEKALQALGGSCEELLRLLFFEKDDYDQVSEKLSIAKGTIGPQRGRCLKRLRTIMEGNG